MADLRRLSKFLSLMLRHKAEAFGLALDDAGFTDIEPVWVQIERRYGNAYVRADLEELLSETTAGKQRFERDGERIRAMYGHGNVRDIIYEAVVPPEVLYHGTTDIALPAIRREGLNSQRRQYVHLSTGVERATNVATRHRAAVLLTIRAREAHAAGIVFHHPEPQHYLAKSIPPRFIDFPD